MSAVTTYSRTAANNNSAAPNGWPEGQAASTVNDCAREMMKAIVDEASANACKVLASVAGTNTITGTLTPDLAAYSAGMLVVLTPANTNTGATTLNIDSLGALDVFNIDGTACVGGELVVGVPAVLVLDTGADDWIIVNPNVLKSRGLEAGYRKLIRRQFSTSETLAATDAGKMVNFTGGAGQTVTLTDGVFATNDILTLITTGTNTLALTATTPSNLFWFTGAATTTGARTIAAAGAWVTIYVADGASGVFFISGSGIS